MKWYRWSIKLWSFRYCRKTSADMLSFSNRSFRGFFFLLRRFLLSFLCLLFDLSIGFLLFARCPVFWCFCFFLGSISFSFSCWHLCFGVSFLLLILGLLLRYGILYLYGVFDYFLHQFFWFLFRLCGLVDLCRSLSCFEICFIFGIFSLSIGISGLLVKVFDLCRDLIGIINWLLIGFLDILHGFLLFCLKSSHCIRRLCCNCRNFIDHLIWLSRCSLSGFHLLWSGGGHWDRNLLSLLWGVVGGNHLLVL